MQVLRGFESVSAEFPLTGKNLLSYPSCNIFFQSRSNGRMLSYHSPRRFLAPVKGKISCPIRIWVESGKRTPGTPDVCMPREYNRSANILRYHGVYQKLLARHNTDRLPAAA